ncbi:MAG: nitronate monooxygenase family protein [Burkholderiales bacterium]
MTRVLHTPLCELLGIDVPILQAPMAGTTTPALAAACSEAGALGSIGFAYAQPEQIRRDVEATRALTGRPININFFTSPQPLPPDAAAQADAIAAVAGYYRELGVTPPVAVSPPYAPDLDAQLDTALALKPGVVTVHLGDLPRERIGQFRAAGIRVGASATSVEEARHLEALGIDFIIAQGAEAGGHRGTFRDDPYHCLTGTLALTRLIVSRVKTPVVAAGGIMDGAGIAAALALGAQAAQLGTAFMPCPESAASAIQRQTLLAQADDATVITEKFSGKPARGIENRYMRESTGFPQLPFPAQHALTSPLRTASAKAGVPDFVALWAGQAVALSRALPAAELVRELVKETLETVDRLARLAAHP